VVRLRLVVEEGEEGDDEWAFSCAFRASLRLKALVHPATSQRYIGMDDKRGADFGDEEDAEEALEETDDEDGDKDDEVKADADEDEGEADGNDADAGVEGCMVFS